MVSFTFNMRCQINSARVSVIYLIPFTKFGWVPYATPGNEAQRKNYGGWVKTPVLFLPVCGPQFTKFSDDVGDPSYFPTPLPDCLCHVSFRKKSPLRLEVVEKPNKRKSFWPPIFGSDDPDFSTANC